MKKILLVEDDVNVCSFINRGLTEEGFNVSIAMDGQTGLQMVRQGNYDILILDIMLPTINGLEVCRQVRAEQKDIPILMLTALGSTENVVIGLDTGADDYLVKPFKLIELLARIRTLLRRSETFGAPVKDETVYRFSDLELNDERKTVSRAGKELSLTSTEYRLLLLFMKNPMKVLSRKEMLDEVWGINFDIGTNVVDVYVNYLRKKLDVIGAEKLIHTVIGMGYVLKESE
ncbi:MAG: response regulator transcription factor [Cyclobacteriaceae bacterium]|nr:response regulator transcription factor [Cyclobacteriaceae bacterium]